MKNLPILIIIFPLCAAFLALAFSRINRNLGRNVTFFSLVAAFVMSIMQIREVLSNGTLRYAFGGYRMPYGIEFVIDSLSALIIAFVCLLGMLTCMFCFNFEGKKESLKVGGAYTMLALLVVGMVGMTSTGDVFNLYVFLEITSLSGYCLIALGGSRGTVAAFRYMLIGTVSATFYLLGVGILYAQTGTLNMRDMTELLNSPGHEQAMLVAMCLFIAAFGIKMAIFPFHAWQPSAYAHAETGAIPLISGAMGKIPAYALFRYMYFIYGKDYVYFRYFLIILGVISCFGMIYGSLRAMAQSDIRKLLAYSSIAQIGYIAMGFAIGNPAALAGAFLHMIGHGFMKGGLFFCTGAIRYKYGTVNMNDFGRIYKSMPFTSGLIVLTALSMIGVPPAVGFFSKWYLALGAADSGQYVFIAILVLSSLLNAIYFFKLIEKVFINKPVCRAAEIKPLHAELPFTMLTPIVICFMLILSLGVFNVQIIDMLMLTVRGVGL